MRVFVYYEDGNDGSRRIERRAVEVDYLEDEMDAIEYALGREGNFRFVPDRKLQIARIQEVVKSVAVDPYQNDWPFRQAFLTQVWAR